MPPSGSFDGQITVVTGGTSGLGFAAAVHLLNLGAKEVIITCRDASRGSQARTKIEAAVGTKAKGKVTVMELDMDRTPSVVAFVDALKRQYGSKGVDFIILNAGLFMPDYVQGPEGWEETIQVNVLSNVLLGLLLVPWLKEAKKHRRSPAHLTYVSSGMHTDPDVSMWLKWAEKEGGILAHFNNEENWKGKPMSDMYRDSKLLQEYALKEIYKMALDSNGEPEVIVNSVCPGEVKTNLSRRVAAKSWIYASVIIPVYTTLKSKSPEEGAKLYVAAGLAKKGDHGKFWAPYWSDEQIRQKQANVMETKAGKEAQRLVWSEIVSILEKKVPAIHSVLAAPTA